MNAQEFLGTGMPRKILEIFKNPNLFLVGKIFALIGAGF